MINPENQLDEHFRDGLEDLEINPPERVWAGIANHLDRAEINRDKKRVAWLWWLSATSLVISLTAVTAMYFKGHDQVVPKEAQTAQVHPSQDKAGNGIVNNDNGNITADNSAHQPVAGAQDNSSYSTSPANSSYSNNTSSVSSHGKTSATTKGHITKTSTNDASSEADDTHVYRNTPVRHAAPVAEVQPEPEKQYKLYEATTTEEMIMPAAGLKLLPQESLQLAGTFQPFADITYIPGRIVCPRWKVGVTYTYAWNTFRHLEEGDSLGYYQGSSQYLQKYRLAAAHFDSIEHKQTGFSKGIALGYRVLPHFTLNTGVELSQYNWQANIADAVLVKDPNQVFSVTTSTAVYNTDSINGMAASDFFSIAGFTPVPMDPDTVVIQHKFNYVSIPLSVSYNLLKPCAKVGVSLNAGVTAAFLKDYTVTHNGAEKELKADYTRSRSMELVTGLSVSYTPIRHLSIEVQPVYRRFIQPVNKFQSVKAYPYMWGLQGGMYFKF